MKTRITFELPLIARQAISHRVGRKRPADRDEIKQWIDSVVNASLDQLISELPDKPDKEGP